MNEEFGRQRRNLLLITSVIVFLYFTGIQVDSINLAVFSLKEIPKPGHAIALVWLVWFWFLVRYIQYLYRYESKAVATNMSLYLVRAIHYGSNVERLSKKLSRRLAATSDKVERNLNVWEYVEVEFHLDPLDLDSQERKSFEYSLVSFLRVYLNPFQKYLVNFDFFDSESKKKIHDFESKPIRGVWLIAYIIFSLMMAVVVSSKSTDYYAPLIAALVTFYLYFDPLVLKPFWASGSW